ncbi:MAG: hypothetical protein AB8H86_33275 [Polyangiales bacterium]
MSCKSVVPLLLCILLGACGDDDAGPDASPIADASAADTSTDTSGDSADSGQDAPTTGSVTLAVVSENTERLGGGGLYSLVVVRFENNTNRTLPIGHLSFEIRDDEGNMEPGNEVGFNDRCTGDVEAGASDECGVAFNVVTGAVFLATEIRYTGPDGISASAPIPVDECERCGGDECIDLMTDSAHCGTCDFSVGALACEGGAPMCEDGSVFEIDACAECTGPLCFPPHRLSEDDGSHIVRGLPPISCDDACALLGQTCVVGEYQGTPTPNAVYVADVISALECADVPDVDIGGLRFGRSVCTCE